MNKAISSIFVCLILFCGITSALANSQTGHPDGCVHIGDDIVIIIIFGNADGDFRAGSIVIDPTWVFLWNPDAAISPENFARPSQIEYSDTNGDGYMDANLHFWKDDLIAAGLFTEPGDFRLHFRDIINGIQVLFPKVIFCEELPPTATATAIATATPEATATPTVEEATPTATPEPTATDTPEPTATNTPEPTATPIPATPTIEPATPSLPPVPEGTLLLFGPTNPLTTDDLARIHILVNIGDEELASYNVKITYDPTALELVEPVESGDDTGEFTGPEVTLISPGIVRISGSVISGATAPSGELELAEAIFRVLDTDAETASLTPSDSILLDNEVNLIGVTEIGHTLDLTGPEPTATPEPIATDTPEPTATDTPEPTATPTAEEATPTATPEPTATETPEPTATEEATATPTVEEATPTATAEPTATETPEPTATEEATATPTIEEATPTATPEPTATNTPEPTATNTPEPTATPALPSVPEDTLLLFGPSDPLSIGNEARIHILVNIGEKELSSYNVKITYDTTALELVEPVESGNDTGEFTGPEVTPISPGIVRISGSLNPGATGPSGELELAEAIFRVLASATDTTSLTPSDSVLVDSENFLIEVTEIGHTLDLTGPEPTATPEPEPTATNTPEPTATDTPEPTATQTPESIATPTLAPGENLVSLLPDGGPFNVGDTITTRLVIDVGSSNLGSYGITIHFDPTVLEFLDPITAGSGTGTNFLGPNRTILEAGQVRVFGTHVEGTPPTGEVEVALVQFLAIGTTATGTTILSLSDPDIRDASDNVIPVNLVTTIITLNEVATVTPTPEATATDTPEPTATDTPEAIATDTPEPTATDTPEATATPTIEEATPTATPEPTATNTPEPTATNTPEPTATPELPSVPEGTLRLFGPTDPLTTGDLARIHVLVNIGDEDLSSYNVKITYDTTALELVEPVESGDDTGEFTGPEVTFISPGIVRISGSIIPGATAPSGELELAEAVFSVLDSATETTSLTPSDSVLLDSEVNLIGVTEIGHTLDLTGPAPTPTPEPTATNTPEPTATDTPEPTATDTPEPVATDTPEPTATDTPEPVATDTPEPTATPIPATPTITPATPTLPSVPEGTLLLFGPTDPLGTDDLARIHILVNIGDDQLHKYNVKITFDPTALELQQPAEPGNDTSGFSGPNTTIFGPGIIRISGSLQSGQTAPSGELELAEVLFRVLDTDADTTTLTPSDSVLINQDGDLIDVTQIGHTLDLTGIPATPTPEATATPEVTATNTPEIVATPIVATPTVGEATPTATPENTATPTVTPEPTVTATPAVEPTASPTEVPSATPVIHADIRPGYCPNPVQVNRRGLLPVALLGTSGLDISQIDPDSIRLEGVAPHNWHYADVSSPFEGELTDCSDCNTSGKDGNTDLVLKFDNVLVVATLLSKYPEDVLGPINCLHVHITGRFRPEFGGGSFHTHDTARLQFDRQAFQSWLRHGKGAFRPN